MSTTIGLTRGDTRKKPRTASEPDWSSPVACSNCRKRPGRWVETDEWKASRLCGTCLNGPMPAPPAGRYGSPPVDLGPVDLAWDEFMHYVYLPVRIPRTDEALPGGLSFENVTGRMFDGAEWTDGQELRAVWALPERLEFLWPAISRAVGDARATAHHLADPYVYVTARRGYASPGSPLNRPGWHTDDFGGTDLNYIWSDTYPTRFLTSGQRLIHISDDDQQSMKDMADYAVLAQSGERWLDIQDGPVGHLLRLDPYVVHNTPIIPAPGGMRSFFKISVSDRRYNLRGNSHNHMLDYDWPMVDREPVRNQPAKATAQLVTA